MAGKFGRYTKHRWLNSATTTAGTVTTEPVVGWGDYNQLIARLEVATCTGGSDAFDAKVQYKIGETWVDLITMTQATAATTETKMIIRTASVGWTNEIRLVYVTATGATATGVVFELIGAVA